MEECGDASGWFAEYAVAQLGTQCSTRPEWVAWIDGDHGHDRAHHEAGDGAREAVIVLWARDARAARRGLLALGLESRLNADVHVLLPRGLVGQLQRCAAARNNAELHVHGGSILARKGARAAGADADADGAVANEAHTWPGWCAQLPASLAPAARPPKAYEAWATIAILDGTDLDRLRERRAASSADGRKSALAKVEALSSRLLELDPQVRRSTCTDCCSIATYMSRSWCSARRRRWA